MNVCICEYYLDSNKSPRPAKIDPKCDWPHHPWNHYNPWLEEVKGSVEE